MLLTPLRPSRTPRPAETAARLEDFARYAEVKRLVYGIIDMQRQEGIRSLAVLSPFPGDGRTLLCAALASAYAKSSRSKVLVVDATTNRRPRSLVLKECLGLGDPLIDVMSLAEARNGFGAHKGGAQNGAAAAPEEASPGGDLALSSLVENDHSLIRKVAKEGGRRYGLVLLDTAPLTARNKDNLDPSLVARLSDASVLVVSRALLDAPGLEAHLALLKDPALRLVGAVSNEAWSR